MKWRSYCRMSTRWSSLWAQLQKSSLLLTSPACQRLVNPWRRRSTKEICKWIHCLLSPFAPSQKFLSNEQLEDWYVSGLRGRNGCVDPTCFWRRTSVLLQHEAEWKSMGLWVPGKGAEVHGKREWCRTGAYNSSPRSRTRCCIFKSVQ